MRTVAVTGASGLIGTALTAALEKRGDRVVPIGRRPPAGGVAWDLAARRIDEAALEEARDLGGTLAALLSD